MPNADGLPSRNLTRSGRPPDVIINRSTKEVTRYRSLSEAVCTAFLAPRVLRMAVEEQRQKKGGEATCQGANSH